MVVRHFAVRLAGIVLLALLAWPDLGRAQCTTNCPFDVEFGPTGTTPSLICVVGFTSTGQIDPAGEFVVTVRDVANNPVEGATVDIDFSRCTGLSICGVAGSACATMDPVHDTVRDFTDAAGQVRLRVAGGLDLPYGAPESQDGRARIRVCGFLFSSPPVCVADMEGRNGVNSADLAFLATDIGAHTYIPRADFDGNLIVNGADLAWLATLLGLHSSLKGCANH